MLHCRACLSRCTRALESSTLQTHRLRRDGSSALVAAQQRFASNSTRDDRNAQQPLGVRKVSRAKELSAQRREPWERSKRAQDLKVRGDRALRRPVDREQLEKSESVGEIWLGKRDPRISQAEWDRRRRELQYLHDPLEVAAFVKQELAKGKSKEMLQLVRMASHSMQVVVSWNHVINDLMTKERVSEALKVYNEMKKRAQFPDSYTYTIVLRGLAANAHHSGAASKAVAIYHSMSAPNSRVQPSIIHTNAVVNVCARTLDMDALWGIAAKIPESGPGAADATTFTTILNAIRQSLLVDAPHGESEQELAHRRERGVVEGRRMWEDIVGKWRNADLIIEEELVCAMGRLLLIGSRPRDWDDVLSLVEQTMDIPRLVPRLGTIAREALPRIRAPNTPQELKFDDDHLSPDKGPTRGDEFLALTRQGERRPLTYASPSNETLSMIQEACQKIVAPKAATEYWDMLTDPVTYGIVPDSNNLHQRLRLLRINRASAAAVQMLQEDFVAKGLRLKPGTFRIAMSTCVRDRNNHNSLRHASQLLHLMMTTLPDADPKTTTKYAELALTFPLAKGEDLVEALTFLQPVVKSLRIQLGVGAERTHGGNGVGAVPLKGVQREDAMAAIRKVYAVYDRLLLSNLLPEEQKSPFKAERARMSALLQRLIYKTPTKSLPITEEEVAEGTPDAFAKESGGTGEARERERPRRSWRASRASPPDRRKPWSSPSRESQAAT
ncbi:hypothetical protein N0V90_000509 [Kalmusia sp. IMI 367209]|nr:hypothetical protein N0V90_000509 [Kalmusia sp. IMI 367209]